MSNPFADRIRTAAQEGYVTSTARRQPRLAAARTDRPATDRQVYFATNLINERDRSGETRPAWVARLDAIAADPISQLVPLTAPQCGALIDYLLTLPVQTEAADTELNHLVPAGHYAVVVADALMFVKVDRLDELCRAGRVFVTRQLSDDQVRMSREMQSRVLNAIETQGAATCSASYGRELGHCGVCGRTLTNEESRSEGIGPVCRAKNGW